MSERYVITPTARSDIEDIFEFIAVDNPQRAAEYAFAATECFEALTPQTTYKRASAALPKAVREMPVKGFSGYYLRTLEASDGHYFLLSAHRPGRSDAAKNSQTRRGLRDLDER